MPAEDLNVALLPIDIIPSDSDANLDLVASRIEALPSDIRLIILPEMFNSGFIPDKSRLHEISLHSIDALQRLQSLSDSNDTAICGSMVMVEGDNLFNRAFFVQPEQSPVFYDKRHLFSAGEESKVMTAGTRPSPIITYRSWHIKIAVCYDIRFPLWNRCRNLDYDALIVPANWPHSRYYAWKHMLIARAIENQIYVLGCNREGSDHYGDYRRGDSMILDPWGKPTGDILSDGTLLATLDHARINNARTLFTPWRDADNFTIL